MPLSVSKSSISTFLTAFLISSFSLYSFLQLDSVTSLIQAAKNLMNAVVQTVKMSYIASTKIIRIQSAAGPRHPVVMWRMKAPAKKPLIKREKPEETYAAVRRGSAKKKIHPVQVMSEFRGREVYWSPSPHKCPLPHTRPTTLFYLTVHWFFNFT